MGIFKPADPEIVLQKAIAAERTLRGELESRLVAARKTAEERQHEARKATRDLADDKSLLNLEEKQVVAERRVTNISLELDDSTERLAKLEAELNGPGGLVDQRQRREAAAEEEADDIGLGEDYATLDKALAAFAARCEKISSRRPLRTDLGLANYTTSMRVELPPAVEMFRKDNKAYAASILSGAAPVILPQPVPTPAPPPQPAPQAWVLSAKPIAWHDAEGMLRTEPRLRGVSLPVVTADRAVEIGAAVRPGHALWKQKDWGPNAKPGVSDCINLDDPDAPVAPIPESATTKPPATVHPLQSEGSS